MSLFTFPNYFENKLKPITGVYSEYKKRKVKEQEVRNKNSELGK
jgi:hypothetical protein